MPAIGMLLIMLLVRLGGSEASEPVVPRHYIPALSEAERILVRVTATGPTGPEEVGQLVRTVSRRLNDVGFLVVPDARHAHDVEVEITCEYGSAGRGEDGTAASDNTESRGRPRLGAPCVVGYSVQGRTPGWQRLNHVVFDFGVKAATSLPVESQALAPREVFTHFLTILDFPVLLAAEWAQVDRLRRLLESRDTDVVRKKHIIFLLGEIHAQEAMLCLLQALDDEQLVRDAALSLGNFGVDARPSLIRLLRGSPRPDVQAAAARSLGRIGATTGDWSLTPLFIDMLRSPELDIAVQIELVLAVGKNPDRSALPVLEQLYERVWNMRSQDPRLDELRLAIDWSHRSVRLGGHGDQY